MEVSLSIASFPLDSETVSDMHELLKVAEEDYSKTLAEYSWQKSDAAGFAVLAYTEEQDLLGFAAALDLIGLDSYEWSMFVHPSYRRHSIGTALAQGVAHGLEQRKAIEDIAAFIESREAQEFMASLGYQMDFKEIELAAEPLADYSLPQPLAVSLYNGESEALEKLMAAAFEDDEIIPVIHYNIASDDREVFVMKRQDQVVAGVTLIKDEAESAVWITAFAVDPLEQGKGYGKAFLFWCRHYALQQGIKRIVLEVETDNEALAVYEKSGFKQVHVIEYWKKAIE